MMKREMTTGTQNELTRVLRKYTESRERQARYTDNIVNALVAAGLMNKTEALEFLQRAWILSEREKIK